MLDAITCQIYMLQKHIHFMLVKLLAVFLMKISINLNTICIQTCFVLSASTLMYLGGVIVTCLLILLSRAYQLIQMLLLIFFSEWLELFFLKIILLIASRIILLKICWYFLGPNLNGLFGRQSGTTAGYSYSTANKNMAVIWQESTLYDYLLNPKKVLLLISSLLFVLEI